ncbi:hypothetical protein [Pinibacter aurantiacus]|uniref:Uncharacterized protein n=1 Tax=Pinibacter aurantiacus TaxID=2851599 RepID=A0A9E2W4W4_9BACT|nr:hypothetical protein [Pinibacter aurantiacus]MBV4360225.1 hypothetical protein [Pinibacter aurantiacus]
MKNRKIIPAIAFGAIAAGAATYYFIKRRNKTDENGHLTVKDRSRGIRHVIYAAKRFQHGDSFR